MNSLRARLIWGFSLVAVVPLSLALALLGTRIRQTMEQQSAARLEGAIRVAHSSLANDGQRLAARVELLARDPQLKRLYLVGYGSGLELRQLLAEQRFLLGLDYLAVLDTAGRVAADASLAPPVGGRASNDVMDAESLPVATRDGLEVLALTDDSGLALDARAPIPYAGTWVGRVRGGVRVDAAFLTGLKRLSGLELLLRDARGRVLATTLTGREAPAMRPADSSVARVRLGGHTYLTREVDLWLGAPGAPPRLTALASTAAADEALSVLGVTAVALGVLGVLLAIVLGMVWSHQVSSPLVRLAGFSERISRGEWDEPLAMESMRELQTLVNALERMRHDLRAYRENLRASERQAAYGQMARKVAHEIKNPLTPIALSVQGLKRSYDQKHPDFGATLDEAVRMVGEEVQRLKSLLQEFNELGRFPPPRPERLEIGGLLGDLKTMFHSEVAAGRLAFELPPASLPVVADPGQLRQALINLIQNALDATAAPGVPVAGGSAGSAAPGAPAAGGSAGSVRVAVSRAPGEAGSGDSLAVAVSDDGPGMSEAQRAQLFVPGFTTKTHGSGLGLTIVERIVSDHKGTIEVDSSPGRGTSFVIRLPMTPEA